MSQSKPRINPSTLKRLRQFYVTEGLTITAITAQMHLDVTRVQELVHTYNLDAERELYLEQNPNISALVAASKELRRIHKKQQNNGDLSASERGFLMKYLEAEANGVTSQEQFYNWSREKLDERIKELSAELYGGPKKEATDVPPKKKRGRPRKEPPKG